MKTKRKTINTILLALMVIAAAAGWSRAQTPTITSVRAQIERNEQLLVEAEVLVRATNSVKARAALNAAHKLHEASKTFLSSDRVGMAGVSAKKARDAIARAIAIAKREAKLEENALKAIERASTRYDRAKNLLDEQRSRDAQPAKKLLEESRHQLHRSKNNMREHMFEVALRLANASIELSNRAIKSLKRDSVVPDKVMREITRTDRILERADLNADPAQSHLLRNAHDLQDQAKRAARENRNRVALEHTKRARTIANRALKDSPGANEGGRERAEKAVALTGRLLDQTMDIAREQHDEDAINRLNEAARLQKDAVGRLENGQYKPALRFTLRAREIVKNTMRSLNKPLDAGKVRQALERTDGVLAKLRTALDNNNNGPAEALFKRAVGRQAAAWDALESGEPRKALANSKIARNLAQKAMRQLGDG